MTQFRKIVLALSTLGLLAVSSLAFAQSAPPLSYVQIRHVGSSNQGWENLSDSQVATTLDHGGAQLRVVTVEVGYGTSRVAKVNGVNLPTGANYQTINFCGSNYLVPCSAGQTIVGFTRYWNLDGYQSGTFSYQTTSINSPWNVMSDTMSIL